ncbi:MAG: NAD(+)/NADH kinase [Dehalococcoidia bacterium]|jgi:NAD+ kinase|nr:MAG: NAD(+)/NADH kinase [Dehalococcoidia bacterium]
MKIKEVGIVFNPLVEAAKIKAGELKSYLDGVSVANWLRSSWELGGSPPEMGGTDLVLSVGGDGTILRVVQTLANTGTPVLGINLGRLGFMTELTADEALAKLPEVLDGRGWLDERVMLEAQAAGDKKTYYALNDIVAARGAVARMVNIEVGIDDEPFATYRADGVILATATGSTGYALAAGGPVLNPQATDLVLIPILPHLSLSYPLVLPGDAAVSLRVFAPHTATLSIDGNINLAVENGTKITARRSKVVARFWRVHPRESFYRTLEQKLRGEK